MRIFVLFLLFFSPLFSYAAGGDLTGSIVPSCTSGKVWDKSAKRCVALSESPDLDSDNLYEVARDLAYHGRYEEVLDVLSSSHDSGDPRLLNYLGYATRKLGDAAKSLEYYREALEIDPDYHQAREYMGEAFLQLGRLSDAQRELSVLGERCGTDCPEYEMLSMEIIKFTNSG